MDFHTQFLLWEEFIQECTKNLEDSEHMELDVSHEWVSVELSGSTQEKKQKILDELFIKTASLNSIVLRNKTLRTQNFQ